MRFIDRKRRQQPSVILVSLIDILLVLLIFLMLTTTFRKFPSLELTLPEAKEAKTQAREQVDLLVTVSKEAPHLYLGKKPIKPEKLREAFDATTKENPDAQLAVRADTDAPWGIILKVIEAAQAANLNPNVDTFTREPETGKRGPQAE